jgi:hypothetical protein
VPAYAINIRPDNLASDGTAVRITRSALRPARKLIGQRVLLYSVRDASSPGYSSLATVGDCVPVIGNDAVFWLRLADLEPLQRVVSLEELYGFLGEESTPFFRYSRPIHEIPDRELAALIEMRVITPGFSEDADVASPPVSFRTALQRARDRRLRFRVLEAYGGRCAITARRNPSLDGLRFGIDICHLQALEDGGPDSIFNLLPMLPHIHGFWDEGSISMTDSGIILVARQANNYVRSQVVAGAQAIFPKDVSLWPKAEFLQFHRGVIFEKGPTRTQGKRP